jgi:hypothetical protein
VKNVQLVDETSPEECFLTKTRSIAAKSAFLGGYGKAAF